MSTLNRTDKVWYLRQTGLFDRLGESELQRIAEMSRMREFPRGALILGPNSDPDLIYLVKAGRVKISTFSPDGKEQILALTTWSVFRRLAGGHHRRAGPPRVDWSVSNGPTDRSAAGSQEARP